MISSSISQAIATKPALNWVSEAFIYHIYALGLTGAPLKSHPEMTPRLDQLYDWIPYWKNLGVNTLLLGPVSASASHGYDTTDLYEIDSRLGDQNSFQALCQTLKANGIRMVLDGVFNHVSRSFWAFQDVLAQPEQSIYRDWFHIRSGHSALGDPFVYDCWEGHSDLVKLNLSCPAVRDYIFGAIRQWVDLYDIDGLRLDVAYCLDRDFLADLARFCRQLKPDFWLMGEMIHGDYRDLLGSLDSVTNYICYKGLWSSHKDSNAFEIAHSLKLLMGPNGRCEGRLLYNFADNHDVDRVASQLHDPQQLFSLYLMMMTMPGIPSLYYGSEFGIKGQRNTQDDKALRPALRYDDLNALSEQDKVLPEWIRRLAKVRQHSPALQQGDYQEVLVRSEQLLFARQTEAETCLVAMNMASHSVTLKLDRLEDSLKGEWQDLLDPGFRCHLTAGCELTLPAHGGRVLRR